MSKVAHGALVISIACLLASAGAADEEKGADKKGGGEKKGVEKVAKVEAKQLSPDFALKDQDGKEVKLSSFRGKKNVLVAFYPKDFTGG